MILCIPHTSPTPTVRYTNCMKVSPKQQVDTAVVLVRLIHIFLSLIFVHLHMYYIFKRKHHFNKTTHSNKVCVWALWQVGEFHYFLSRKWDVCDRLSAEHKHTLIMNCSLSLSLWVRFNCWYFTIFHIQPTVFLSWHSVTVTNPFLFSLSNLYFDSVACSPLVTINHYYCLSLFHLSLFTFEGWREEGSGWVAGGGFGVFVYLSYKLSSV